MNMLLLTTYGKVTIAIPMSADAVCVLSPKSETITQAESARKTIPTTPLSAGTL
ncbi:MAG: hypothetical protein GX685_07820 [Clostridiales bacterium]|nr:hypothetical protein [Clostridiales bacterium]